MKAMYSPTRAEIAIVQVSRETRYQGFHPWTSLSRQLLQITMSQAIEESEIELSLRRL